jgi:glycosyltransferase involved in cell wall biosynthesis
MCDSGGAENVEKTLVVACIPAFNEEGRIAGVVLQVRKYVDRVVVCDDGSVDLTGAIAEGLGAVVIKHERKRGKGAALNSSFRYVRDLRPDVVVVLDADGQHDPGEIPRLVEQGLGGAAELSSTEEFHAMWQGCQAASILLRGGARPSARS